MTVRHKQTIPDLLASVSDIELASLIIEFIDSDQVAVALGEEILRRLTHLRMGDALELISNRPVFELS